MAKRNKIENLPVYRIDMHACMQWCLANGIKIYPIPLGNGEYNLEVNNNGTLSTSTRTYSKMESLQKTWELYCHYFDHNHGK